MRFTRIVLLTLAAVVLYGIVHDQVTVRVCPEYFTVGHPAVFGTASPTLLALAWGIATSVPAGLAFGFLLASVAVNGRSYSPLEVRVLAPWLGGWLLATAVVAGLAGGCGFLLARAGDIELGGLSAERLAPEIHPRYLAVRWAHAASYLIGITGSLLVVAGAWRQRKCQRRGTYRRTATGSERHT